EKDWVTIIFYRTTQEKLDTPSTRDFIIQTIQKNARATRNELAKTTGISANAVKQHIAKLKKDGILIRIGSTKAGHWKIRG
ncbi:MAG: winged helix-turn-helix transcriptional regulator, partial [Victivallales bacterium]|nr:winged helix-turn-helix transcriptional regulator [Victivallales bacterium]